MNDINVTSDKFILLENKKELKETFLNVISNGKYIYKDLLKEYFTNFNYDENFKIRYKRAKVTELKLSSIKLIISYFNDLFFEIDKLFPRDITFPYRLVKYGILDDSSLNIKSTIKKIIYMGYEQEEIKDNLIYLFYEGLSRTKNYCLLKYNGFCNKSSYFLRRMPSSKKDKLVELLSKDLTDKNLIYIYHLNDLSQKQVDTDEEENIISLLKNLKLKVNNIKIELQKISKYNYELTQEIYNYIINSSYRDIKLENISLNYENQDKMNNNLISLDIEIDNNIFHIVLKHIYNELFFYIYYNNTIVAKDPCYRPIDFDRVVVLIINKNKLWVNEEKETWHDLVYEINV